MLGSVGKSLVPGQFNKVGDMSCVKMESQILAYMDGRLKDSERVEMEKHLAACGVCRVRANEFRSVSDLLGELPMVEPTPAFDVRVRARVAPRRPRDLPQPRGVAQRGRRATADGSARVPPVQPGIERRPTRPPVVKQSCATTATLARLRTGPVTRFTGDVIIRRHERQRQAGVRARHLRL